MKTHYTAKELAGLPGMPGHVSNVIKLADRDNWAHQKRAGRGGGKEYALASLPAETQEHLWKEQSAKLPTIQRPAEVPATIEATPLPSLNELTERQIGVMDARAWFMRLIEGRPAKKSIKRAIIDICAEIEAGEQTYAVMAEYANDRKGKGRTLKPRSLWRWWSEKWLPSGRNPASLAPNDGDAKRVAREAVLVGWVRGYRPGSLMAPPSEIPPWLPYLLDEYRKGGAPSLADAVRTVQLPLDMPRPSYDQAYRLWEKIPVIYREKYRKTGAEYRSLLPFTRRDWSLEEPFSCGQIDGHSWKGYVAHPVSGAHFHPEICAVICMRTKYLAGWSAGVAESWRTVSDAFRHACTAYEGKFAGVFSRIEADRGAGNMAIKNSDKLIGIFARAGCTLVVPEQGGNPQGHGGVERSNQSVWIRAAKRLLTYTGKDMDRVTQKKVYTRLEKDLKEVRNAGKLGQVEKTSDLLMTWHEFLEFLEKVVWEYNNTPHSALPKITDQSGRRRHMTPTEAVQDYIARGWEPVGVDADFLPYLFMPHERIKKINRGEFRLHGNLYQSWDLAAYHGKSMIAAYDIHDAQTVWVLTPDQRLVCQATWNGNSKLGRPESAKQREERLREEGRVANKKKQIAMMEAETDRSIVVESPEIEAKRLTVIPAPVELMEQTQSEPRRKVVQLQRAIPEGFRVPDDRLERWQLWNAIHQRVLAEDDTLLDDEIRFYTSFRNSATWKAFDKIRATAL